MKSASNAPKAQAPSADKLGVLFLHSSTRAPLGADTWIQALIMRHLDRSKHDVHVACASGPPDSPTPTLSAVREIPDLSIKTVNLGPELFTKSPLGRARAALETAPAIWNLAALVRYVKTHGIRIVHTTDRPRDALASVILARLTGAKCIVHVHVTYGDWMNPMLRWSMGKADALIGVSDFVARSLVQGGGYAQARTFTALNAIEARDWNYGIDAQGVRAEFGIASDAPMMVCVARIYRAKGQIELIQAMGLLRETLPNLTLMIVGQDYPSGTHHSEELRRLATELGVQHNVVFTGLRSDVQRLIAAADMLAMPSFEEPFGLVFAEAMAMKRPVIGLDNGGAPEVVDHEKSGFLSASGDVVGLAANIRKLALDPELRSKMGEFGRQQVETRFVPERLARDVAHVYEHLMSNV